MSETATTTDSPQVAGLDVLDVEAIRRDFPTLDQAIGDKPLVYLDNAATSQKPLAVIEAVDQYYRRDNANVHRGIHTLSQRATDAYEGARVKLARHLGAASEQEIVFTRGATEAINLIAQSFVRPRVGAGDEILITAMEHHANIVPWQLLEQQTGCKLVIARVDDRGVLDVADFEAKLSDRTKFVSFVHTSNALGTINPVDQLVALAKARDLPVLIDGAQAVPHGAVDVQALGGDFFVFSGHKMFAPTGIGALWGRQAILEEMPPYQGGGDMILEVSFDGTTFNELPYKFEAGTPHIVGAIGLGVACDYLQSVGLDKIAAYEQALLDYITAKVADVPGLRIIGTAPHKASVLSFVMDGEIHPHDIGSILDREGVAIRVGHHCAQPVLASFGVTATARASLAFYNTTAEIDRFVAALHKVIDLFG